MEVVNIDERQEKDWKVFDEFSEIFGYLLKSFFDGVTQVQASIKWVEEWVVLFSIFAENLYIPSNENVDMKEYAR